ncbi:MAG: hypothetical protein ACTSWL_02075 [Promethearchaeota archaeon]
MLAGSIEIFIQYKSICIFYYNLTDPEKQSKVDKQLVSGFLDANSLFFDELDIGKEDNLFRILRGNAELRMLIGKKIHATLLLKNLGFLDLKAYYELDVLTRSIILEFETKYMKELNEFSINCAYNFEGIDHFIQEEVLKMKYHMFCSYLMNILAISIHRNVKREESKELLIALNHAFQKFPPDYKEINMHMEIVRSTIHNYSRIHPTINSIIDKVNKENERIWMLFRIPIIKVFSTEYYKSIENK